MESERTAYKKQHFVPQLLQQFFSVDHTTIGCIYLDNRKTFTSSIANTAQKSWYYKCSDDDKVSIERLYGKIEASVAPILKNLNARDYNLTSEEIECLFVFVTSQLMRTPKAAKAMGVILQFCNNKNIKEVCEEIESGKRTPNNLPMQATIGLPSVWNHLSGKGYVYVQNDSSIPFVLSDNPACLFSPVAELAEERHLADLMLLQEAFSGYILFMPLGPRIGIVYFDDDYYDFGNHDVVVASDTDAIALNSLQVSSAYNILMYKDGCFEISSIQGALQFRSTDKYALHKNTIYTPLNDNFSLSFLPLDENVLIYKMNYYARKGMIDGRGIQPILKLLHEE